MSESAPLRKLFTSLFFLLIALTVARCTSADRHETLDPIELRLAGMDNYARAAAMVAASVPLVDDTAAERLYAEIATGAAGALLIGAGDAETLAEAVHRLRSAAPHPLLVIVDLDSIRSGATALPPARLLAAVATPATARAVGEAAAREARALGADLGLIALPPLNRDEPLPIAARNPERLAMVLRAYAEGAGDAGLPLLARALWRTDSIPTTLRWDRARLDAIELRELHTLANVDLAGVALGAVSLPAITGDSLPLAFSTAAIQGLLRRDLAFEGLAIVDLSAGSPLRHRKDAADAAIAAVAAGADLLIGAENPAAVVDALVAAVGERRIEPERLEVGARRVLRLQARVGRGDSARIARDSVPGPLRLPEAAELAALPAVHSALEASGFTVPTATEELVPPSPLTAAGAPSDAWTDSVIAAFRDGAAEEEAAAEEDGGVPGLSSLGWPPARVLREVAADSVKMRRALSAQIDAIMREALEDSVFSAAAVAVGRRGGLVLLRGYGRTGRGGEGEAVDPHETIFDLASLTKVIGTTTAVALLVQDGLMELEAPVERYLPDFDGEGKEEVRIRDLLTHTSGMPSGIWLFGSAGSPDEALRQVLRQDLLREAGERMDYSDLGMILLAEAAERAAGMPLDRFLALRVFAPLGMQSTMYLPPLALRSQIVPTAETTEREFALQGVVHDANSFRLGGIAGHAGLFSTARDLAIFAQMMLNGGSYGTMNVLSPALVGTFTRKQPNAEQRALGWDTPSRVSSAGDYFSARSFGHTGYTGTSLWVDPASEIFVVLLTNRTYLEASAGEILRLRSAVHDAAARAVADAPVRRRPGAR